VSFNWNRIFTIERRLDCCRLGMGSVFSFPDADFPAKYTHRSRFCQVNSEATLKSRPWHETGPVSAEGRSTSAPPGVSTPRRLRRGVARNCDLPRKPSRTENVSSLSS
jgi:hypothetical protein